MRAEGWERWLALVAVVQEQPRLIRLPRTAYPKGLVGSDERWRAVGQLQLPMWRVLTSTSSMTDEADRRTRPPTILREQQRSTGTARAEVAGRAFVRLRKPSVGSAAAGGRPNTARRAAQDRPPGRRWRDRAQPRLLCPPTRAARAALRGRTIIWHRQTRLTAAAARARASS